LFFLSTVPSVSAAEYPDLSLDCVSAILVEAQTGCVLYEKNADEALPPASVTKIMTLLLVMEAIERGVFSYDTMLTASAHAASMGGSQIFLKEGERMSVDDLLKSVVIASANDAAVVLAEAVAGSEAAFVELMNKRAAELGMKAAHFENTNGLDDTVSNHVLSARDIAIMSRELIKHERILKYSSTWMDTVRDGAFGLSNTNRLVRFYEGATGLKTGSTAKAKFCISATAERDGMHLIAVIMASPTRDARNAAAVSLLDWGFANFSLYRYRGAELSPIKVTGGEADFCTVSHGDFCTVVGKGKDKTVEVRTELPESIAAPIKCGDKVGDVVFTLDGKELARVDITATESVERLSFVSLFLRMLSGFFGCSKKL
jgi:D-alanyl-D-alanine carboxypeptidase (penicillin-binding protein 5/6)